MDLQDIKTLALLLSPIVLIQLGLIVYSIVDLIRRPKTRGPRWVWGLILVLFGFTIPSGLIVAGIYLAWGRHGEV